MREAHIFDIETLIETDASVWIVSIEKPTIPIIKISLSEFNLIKKGIYKNHKCDLQINGHVYWLPENLFNLLKVKTKKHETDFSKLSFSMQEYLNPNIIKHLTHTLNIDNIAHLKNKPHDIFIIASKNTERNYKPVVEKLEKELEKLGLNVSQYYYLTKTFNNKDWDAISNNKVKICLQHLIGYKTEDTKFISIQVETYDRVYLYDSDLKTLEFADGINNILNFIKSNTEDELKDIIKTHIRRNMPVFVHSTVTNNKIRPVVFKEIQLEWNHIVKTFESYKPKY